MMDLLNNSVISAIIGAIVGGVPGYIIYRRQRKDAEKKEIRENFKHKAELAVNEWFKDNGDNIKEIYVILCPYIAKLDNDGSVDIEIPKVYLSKESLKHEIIYLENVGKSDINELEIAIADSKNYAILNAETSDIFINSGLISYGVALGERIRIGEAVKLNIYYDKKVPVNYLKVYYRDSMNNVCAQALFLKERKIGEPRPTGYLEWCNQVSVDKNLKQWKRRLLDD